jgi:hypothetical protein
MYVFPLVYPTLRLIVLRAESVCVPSLEYELQNASDQALVTVLQTPAQLQKITLGILRRAPRS